MSQVKALTRILATALLVAGLFLTGVSAQSNGSLQGQVTDDFGGVIIGATITLTDATGKARTATTGNDGAYTFNNLPPGAYNVTAIGEGFALFDQNDVQVTAGERQELNVKLQVAIAQEEVTVSGEQPVSTDPENNANAVVLRGQDLDALPDDPDELALALQALAGPSAGPDGGQIFVDGFTGGRLPPKESIREIRINQNPFSAENDRPGGGRIEILTRPGTDKIRGSAFFSFSDESLNSRNPFSSNRPSYQQRNYGGYLSGPIQKNKSSFFLDFQRRELDDNDLVRVTLLDSNLQPFNFAQSYLTPARVTSFSPRFDYQINQNNTLVARYSFDRRESINQGIGDFSLFERAYNGVNTQHNIQLTETAILTPTVVNETRFQYARSTNERISDNNLPTIQVRDAFTGGGANVGESRNSTTRLELQNFTSFSLLRNHATKVGLRLRYVNIDDISQINYNGTITFAGIPATLADGSDVITSLEQYRNARLGIAGFRPSQFSVSTGNTQAGVSQTDLGLYIQDDWRVRQNLTLNFGLRYEVQNNIHSPLNFAPRLGFAWSPGAGGTAGSPPKTVLRGGIGIYYDRFGENFTLQADRFGFDSDRQTFLVRGSTPAEVAFLSGIRFAQDGTVTSIPALTGLPAASRAIYQTDDTLQSPYTVAYNLSAERQLPGRISLSVGYFGFRQLHALRQRNINAPFFDAATNTTIVPLQAQGITSSVFNYESTGRLNLNNIFVGVNSRFSQYFTFFSNYSFGYSRGDTDGAGSQPSNPYNLRVDYGRTSFDVRHRFFFGGNINVPRFNLAFSPLITASTGSPFNITSGQDTNRDGIFNDRPTFTQLAARCDELSLNYSFCNPGGVGNPNDIIPRNFGQGPSSFNVNLRISKNFFFGDRGGSATPASATASGAEDQRGGGRRGNNGAGGLAGGGGRRGGGGGGFGGGGGNSDKRFNMQFSVQIENLLNHNNKGNPVGNLASPLFGQSINTGGGLGGFGRFIGGGGGGGGNAAAGNRRVTAQVRFNF